MSLAAKNPVNVRGVCPSLPEPMATGDGLLARLALAAPLTPAQFAGLVRLAASHGNGIVEVTARGKLQVRGLSEASAGPFAADVGALGLPMREGLEIQINPLAGLAPMRFDPRPLAEAITAGVEADGLAARLAPKVAVVVDGGGALHLAGLSADLRLEPAADADDDRVLVSAASRPLGLVPREHAADAALRLLIHLARHGRTARMADVVRETPVERLHKLLENLALAPPPAMGERKVAELIGVHPLANGRVALGIGLPFGHGEAAQLTALAEQVEDAGAFAVAPAAGRVLLLIGVPADAAPMLRSMSAALGFIIEAHDPRRHVAACPGKPACASAFIETRVLAAALAPLAGGRSVHVSGCVKGCAHPGRADLTIVGLDAGAGLVVEGGPRDAPVEIVPVARLADAARSLLEMQGG